MRNAAVENQTQKLNNIISQAMRKSGEKSYVQSVLSGRMSAS